MKTNYKLKNFNFFYVEQQNTANTRVEFKEEKKYTKKNEKKKLSSNFIWHDLDVHEAAACF